MPVAPTTWAISDPGPAAPPRPALGGMMGMAEFMREAQDLHRLKTLEARLQFHVVSLPEDGRGSCQAFPTVAAVVAHLQPMLGQRGQVFVIFGDRWHLTKGPLKFLVPPRGSGDRIPLFQSMDELEVDPNGETSLDATTPEDALPADPTDPS